MQLVGLAETLSANGSATAEPLIPISASIIDIFIVSRVVPAQEENLERVLLLVVSGTSYTYEKEYSYGERFF